jgi:4-aminobutyrate aminotransferase-like enzyme
LTLLSTTPDFTIEQAGALLREIWGIEGDLRPLPSERDQNFRVDAPSGERYVLKLVNAAEDPAFLDAQTGMLEHLAGRFDLCPRLVPTAAGQATGTARETGGREHPVRLVTFVPGKPLAEVRPRSLALLRDLGRRIGRLDRELRDFDHAALHREFHWDLARGLEVVGQHVGLVEDPWLRSMVERLVERFERHTLPRLDSLRRGTIHNDANDHNVIVDDSADPPRVAGVVDFGDALHGYTVGDPAIGSAYALLDEPEPLDAIAAVTGGYHAEHPLTADEIGALYGLACLRLCTSVCMAAYQQRQRPDDPYLAISQEPIRRALPKLLERPFELAHAVLRDACASAAPPAGPRRTVAEVVAARRRSLGSNLAVAYATPVHLVRGWMQYLFDADGRRYLDGYNNVPHVGHCHPRVVEAAARQMARLNTNTRYLYDALDEYAGRLARTLPDPLEVCWFVNSASEANELALRLARAYTGGRDTVVLEAAYHGHTTTLIDLSPYKHAGPGGEGPAPWVHVVPVPDLYRGRYREDDPSAATRYAAHVTKALGRIEQRGDRVACFIAETCPSVGGQLFLPAGYLPEVYARVREAGGLCVADEVQTGYGRLGSSFYAFETHEVVPDIVVLGKPIGNGHPLGAVITTREIAAAFDTGMEFFSTFGGNTVSCEVGLSVLDVVESEGLQLHAAAVGDVLLSGLRELQREHACIGDVRGSGLFLGVELVRDRDPRTPVTREARAVVNRMRDDGVLIGTDGPDHNVLKIRPPMPFDAHDAAVLLESLASAIATVLSTS